MNIDCVLNKLNSDKILMREKKAIIAFSGGPDSTFLVEIFREYYPDIKLYLYHLNHNIRKNASNDENFVRKYSNENDLKLYLSNKDIPKISSEKKIGLEEAGRIERYSDLNKLSSELNINTVITAHHLDDDIETFIMNFKRGSGMNGYSSIKERDGIYFRPLLSVNKKFILDFLKRKNITYCIDETNFIADTFRNEIRLNVIPELKNLDDNFYNDFSNFLSTMKSEYQLKKRFIDSFIKDYNLSDKEGELTFKIEDATKFFGDDLTSLFFHAIDKLNGNTFDVYKTQLMGINSIAKAREEKRIEVMGVLLIKSFDSLIFKKDCDKKTKSIYLTDTKTTETIDYISPIYLAGNLKIRNREARDKIRLPKRPNKNLKKLMIENKIPAFLRDSLFVISDDEGILYVEMIGRAERATGGKEKIYINERKNNE